jgi:uncharacterized protein (TIGR02145 family)
MKTKSLLVFMIFFTMANVFSQKLSVHLTFSAINNGTRVILDSTKIMNRTQGCDTVIYYPDTTITYEITPGDMLLYIGYSNGFPVGVQEINREKEQFLLFQNYPNPVNDQSIISIYIPEEGKVNIIITDFQGRILQSSLWNFNKGKHAFRFTPAGGNLFFLTALWKSESQSIKIFTSGYNAGKRCMLDYIGISYREATLKSLTIKAAPTTLESGILDAPATDETYNFEFATNIPCPGMPTVSYVGQVYNTIQIFSQCWLKENLNVGSMINGSQNQTNNSIIEKYCYENEPDSCTKYGGLYQWDEVMQYTTQQGAQGICPPGWHLPTDEEWKVLEGAVDSQYAIGDPEWDGAGFRGYDAGTNLKTTTGWDVNGNGTDLFGFSGLPGGERRDFGDFTWDGWSALWWSSLEAGITAWYHQLYFLYPGISWYNILKVNGYSVRCLKDY